MPAATYLSFSLHRAGVALGLRHPQLAEDLEAPLRDADRRELARYANGIHGTREEAEDYARREGPMLVLTPEGEVLRVERQRNAAADERIAAEERAYAERLRQLTWREARPNFSA